MPPERRVPESLSSEILERWMEPECPDEDYDRLTLWGSVNRQRTLAPKVPILVRECRRLVFGLFLRYDAPVA